MGDNSEADMTDVNTIQPPTSASKQSAGTPTTDSDAESIELAQANSISPVSCGALMQSMPPRPHRPVFDRSTNSQAISPAAEMSQPLRVPAIPATNMIRPPPGSSNGVQPNGLPAPSIVFPQPARPPRNLMEVLGECVKLGPSNEPIQMDDMRKKLLDEILSSFGKSVPEVLSKAILVLALADVDNVSKSVEYQNALKTIGYETEVIDYANDFLKLGGLDVLKPFFHSKIADCKVEALEAFATVVQNNPYALEVCNKGDEVLNILVGELMDASSQEADINSLPLESVLYALSCFLRENIKGCEEFKNRCRGFHFVFKLLKKSKSPKVLKKCLYIIRSVMIAEIEKDGKADVDFATRADWTMEGNDLIVRMSQSEPIEIQSILIQVVTAVILHYKDCELQKDTSIVNVLSTASLGLEDIVERELETFDDIHYPRYDPEVSDLYNALHELKAEISVNPLFSPAKRFS